MPVPVPMLVPMLVLVLVLVPVLVPVLVSFCFLVSVAVVVTPVTLRIHKLN